MVLDMKQASSSTLLLTLMVLAANLQAADSFVPLGVQQQQSSLSSLQLIPGQGNQLVAAYNAATCQKKDGQGQEVDEGTGAVIQLVKPSSSSAAAADVDYDGLSTPASQSLASRIFSLPSALIGGNRKKSEKNSNNDDVVLYPLVGFKLVHNGEKVIALPTKSHVACRLPVSTRKDEDVYGWYSPSCSLNLYAEDISENPSSNK